MSKQNLGGYVYEFVGTPPDMFICKICHYPSREPHLSLCCGHTFCKSCLEGSKNTVTSSCPICRSEEFATFPNKQGDRVVRSLHVYCTNKQRGCEWQGEVNDIINHLENSDVCQYEDVQCPNGCGKVLQRQYMASHVETECSNSVFTKLVATTRKLGSTYPVDEIGSAMLNDANTTKGIPCPPNLQTELEKSKSSNDFFATMKNYPTHWNFLNVEVFKKLAGKDQEFIQSIDNYTDSVSRMKLNDINFPAVAYDEKFYTPINVTVDVDPSSVTVGDLFKYQSQLAKFLSIDRSALILVKVSVGSLRLVFIVGSAVMLFGLYNLRNASLYYHRHNGEVTFRMQLRSDSDTKDNAGAGASSKRMSTATTPLSLPHHPIFDKRVTMDVVVRVAPRVASYWEEIGYRLRLEDHDIDIIGRETAGDLRAACNKMMRAWISSAQGRVPKTWRTFVMVLHEIDIDCSNVVDLLQREP